MYSSKKPLHLKDEFEPPSKKLASDADIFIKELVKKQQKTVIDLNHTLVNPKVFCKGEELLSTALYNAGPSSLSEFKELTTHLDHVAFLKGAGLVENEINLYLDYLKGEDYLWDKHRNSEKATLRKTINDIQAVIQKYKEKRSVENMIDMGLMPEISKGLDFAPSVKPCNDATKLYMFALENEKLKNKKHNVPPSPMDNIKQIEEDFLKSLSVLKLPTITKIRRKARKLYNRVHRVSESIGCQNTFNSTNSSYAVKSKWDEKTQTMSDVSLKPKQMHTCSPQNYYTIRDGTIIKLNKPEYEARNFSSQQKLTVDEIKQMPKFQDYEKGIPSKVLYLRNLSNSVKESDLKSLFKSYDRNSEVNYKIMKGKMRGQAFVTFTDEIIALQALTDVNGTFVKNKPIIVQFGNGKG